MLKKSFVNQIKKFHKVTILVVVLLVAAIGTYYVMSTHASTPFTIVTADKGTLATGAQEQLCSGASDGSCVVFNGQTQGNGVTYGTVAHPFAANSPINAVIPTSTTYTSASSSLVHPIGGEFTGYGWPLYVVDSSNSSTGTVTCDEYCFDSFNSKSAVTVPIPKSFIASNGSDAATAILDPSTGKTYEFWQLSGSGTSWKANGAGDGNITSSTITGDAIASDLSIFAGTVTQADLTSGSIDHALNVAISNTCTTFQFPAKASDGHGSGSTCLPEGARVQLDPSASLSSITSPFQLMIAKALQTYGAYISDTTGATSMNIRFEDPLEFVSPASEPSYLNLGMTSSNNYYTNTINNSGALMEDDNNNDFNQINALISSLGSNAWHVLKYWDGGASS